MDMDPDLVLQPELFLLGLQRGDEFDVTRVRTQLRALLPPLSAHAPPACTGKNTYWLQRDESIGSEYCCVLVQSVQSLAGTCDLAEKPVFILI